MSKRASETNQVNKVLIIDDDLLFADALRLLLLDEGVAQVRITRSADEAVALADQEAWDIVLLELDLAGRPTLSCGADIRERCPDARIVVLTGESKADRIHGVSRSGVDGFLTKDVTPLHLLRSIRSIREGRAKPRAAKSTPRRPPGFEGMMRSILEEQLTKREKQVLELLVEGLDGCEIARILHVAPNTVRTHVQNVLVKLQVHSRLEAATFAVKHGLIDVPAARAS